MSHDPKHILAANRRLAWQKADLQAQKAALEARCHAQLPELAALDTAIRRTVSRAIAAALQKGTDPAAAVEAARQENLALQEKRRGLLAGIGVDPAQLEDAPLCPVCGDTGWHKGARCRCVSGLCVEENLEELAGQLDLARCAFENFSLNWYDPGFDAALGGSERELMEAALGSCRNYAEAFPRYPSANLYLYGGTGLGKTLLSGCIAKTVAERGYWTVYATAGALFGQYEAVKFNRDADGSAQEDVRRYENCDLLVLDDLGSEMTTPFVQSALYQLLNQRMLTGKHTVISSNLDMEAVRDRYTPQAASRLEGEFQELPFVGRDIRIQKKEQS